MVAIMDADKEGFLRSQTSLIQTIGRAARNVNALVILYADKLTGSIRRAVDETNRRREIQLAYNVEHNITPATIRKAVREGIEREIGATQIAREAVRESEAEYLTEEQVRELEEEMYAAANLLDFERAAELRDRILQLQGQALPQRGIGGLRPAPGARAGFPARHSRRANGSREFWSGNGRPQRIDCAGETRRRNLKGLENLQSAAG